MVAESRSRRGGAARVVSGLWGARLVRLCPLLRAVPLSRAARPACGGIRRLSGLGGGAARSRPPVLGAGLGSVGGAMSVCTQPRCGTHTPLWAGFVGVEPPDPHSNQLARDLCPGGDERLELPHKHFGCCGVWQGDHGEEPVRVDVTEVFPEGCHQLARGPGSVDAVERPQFRVIEGTRAPLLRRSGGWGGHGHSAVVQRCTGRGGVP